MRAPAWRDGNGAGAPVSRALLGRSRRRPGARFSWLAGVVEPGETRTARVREEVREEHGVRAGGVRHLASRPWPLASQVSLPLWLAIAHPIWGGWASGLGEV